MSLSRFRLLAPFLAALLVLGLSLLGTWRYYLGPAVGLSSFVQDGLHNPTAQAFARTLIAREILPLYLGAGILLWLLSLAWGALLDRAAREGWTFVTAGAFVADLGKPAWDPRNRLPRVSAAGAQAR